MNEDSKTRILIADGHPFVCIHYKRVLETQARFVVVGIANDGQDAVKKASELAPDVVISDVFLPKLDGGPPDFGTAPRNSNSNDIKR